MASYIEMAQNMAVYCHFHL